MTYIGKVGIKADYGISKILSFSVQGILGMVGGYKPAIISFTSFSLIIGVLEILTGLRPFCLASSIIYYSVLFPGTKLNEIFPPFASVNV